MALAWSGATTTSTTPARAAAPPPPDRKALIESLERVLQALEAADKEDGREGFEVKALAENIGLDPVKLFEWVRDQTFWVPYHGVLRGSLGVVMDHLGNSLDRSLLLAELLRAKGDKVRLIRASLTAEQAKDLVAKARPVPKNRLAAAEQQSDEQSSARLNDFGKRFGIDAGALKTASEKCAMQAAHIAEATVGRVAQQVPAVAVAIADAAPAGEADNATSGALDPVAAAQDHWWVQRDEKGKWIDLDPMLPDAKAGDHLTEAKGEPRKYDGKLPTEAALCHEVQIRVTIERWEGGKLSEAVILKQTVRPIDVLGKRVLLSHLPTSWPEDVDLLKSKDAGQTIRELASQQHEWVPILKVGSKDVIQSAFLDTGKVNTGPKLTALAKTGGTAKAKVGGLLDTLDAPPGDAAQEGVLTAEWIEYQINSPGQPAKTIRRELFDVLGAAARAAAKGAAEVPKPELSELRVMNRSLSTLGETEIFLQPCELSRGFLGHIRAQGVLANRAVLLGIINQEQPRLEYANEIMDKYVAPPGQVYDLALQRAQCSPVRGDVYLDRPNILSQHRLMKADEKQQLLQCEGFDIVANDVAVRRDAGGAQGAKKIRLQQGITDTVAEAILTTGCGKIENTSELLAASAATGEKWLTIRDKAQLADLSLPPDALARIEEDLAAGQVVLLPKKPIEADGKPLISWWRVDPNTGQTLGVGHQGWGATMTENIILVSRVVLKIGMAYVCLFRTITGPNQDMGTVLEAHLCLVAGAVGAGGLMAGGVVGSAIALLLDIYGAYRVMR